MDLRRVVRGSPVAQAFFLLLVRLLSTDLPSLRVSSYTGGSHGTDSQHPTGTAMDFGIRTAAERADAFELMRRWRLLGLTAIDESNAPGGPHVHVQLFKAGRSTLV